MNSAVEDIKDMIVAQGLATFTTDLFISELPKSPDLCIVLNTSPGRQSELRYEWERPAVHLLVRGNPGQYNQGFDKITLIAKFLHGHKATINGARYALIAQDGDIDNIGKDESNRHLWSTRFSIQRTTA